MRVTNPARRSRAVRLNDHDMLCCRGCGQKIIRRQLLRSVNSRSGNSSRGNGSTSSSHTDSSKPLHGLAIGGVGGTMGSLAGMGGGFVMIPLLTATAGCTQHQAHGTSLAAVAATGLAGAIAYQEYVDVPAAVAISLTGVVSARMGVRVGAQWSAAQLKRALGCLMIVMGPAVPAKTYLMKQKEQEEEAPSSQATPLERSRNSQLVAPALIGVGSGFLAGLFGVGGGTLVVPALTYGYDFPETETIHKQALGTSLAAMVLPAMVGSYSHYKQGTLRPRLAGPLATGALGGAYLGGLLAVHVASDESLQWGFSALLTGLGLRTLLR